MSRNLDSAVVEISFSPLTDHLNKDASGAALKYLINGAQPPGFG